MAKTQKVTLAADYLGQASEALRAAESPEALYRDHFGRRDRWARAIARMLALGNRLEYSRTSILFSAVAAEAYVNHFITQEFGAKDAEGLDRLRTVDKYLFAPRLVFGREVFRRDRQPIQRLTELFALRNELMHPKSAVPVKRENRWIDQDAYERFNPETAAKFLISVAEASLELMTQRSVDDADFTALMIFGAKNLILRYGREAKSKLPSFDAKPVESFMMQSAREFTDKKTGQKTYELVPDPKKVLPRLDRLRGRSPRPKR
jgi:hypothetical protein